MIIVIVVLPVLETEAGLELEFLFFILKESFYYFYVQKTPTGYTQPSLVASSLAFAFSSLAMRATDLGPRTLPPQ